MGEWKITISKTTIFIQKWKFVDLRKGEQLKYKPAKKYNIGIWVVFHFWSYFYFQLKSGGPGGQYGQN